MAAPGKDAAEGDGNRTSPRASGWRVPSIAPTESGLPTAWLDHVPDQPGATPTEPSPAEVTPPREAGEFGRAEVVLRGRRRWSFRRKLREPETADAIEPADIDLVALAADDADRAWTDRTLAALEEPAPTDGDVPGSGIDAFDAVSSGAGGPWALLADELQEPPHLSTETAPRGNESTPRELEEEFWA